ncbi:MAG: ATP-dependent Clp protease ATP-binding subunit, partial [Candidatus Pacebacteria bacterium]|nr:ATP-dependent Clp protease ATP-binding subunit [Candidatus Paceibacterota bacterium]
MNIFPEKIQNKFTTHLKEVVKSAQKISKEFGHNSIGIEHIILSIMSQKGSIGSNMLGEEKIELKNLHKIIDSLPKTKKYQAKLSEELKDVFKKAVLVAGRYKHSYIGTEHLLYAILLSSDKKVLEIFDSIGINSDNLKQQLRGIMESSSRFSDIVEIFDSSLKS